MVPPAPFVPQQAGVSDAKPQDRDSEHAMSIMMAAANALLPAAQRPCRSSAPGKEDDARCDNSVENPASSSTSTMQNVDTIALTHIQELLGMVRTEVLAPRFLCHIIAVAWIATFSAVVSMRRYELQAELFGMMLLGGADVGTHPTRWQPFGNRFKALLIFEALGAILDNSTSLVTSSLAIPWQDRMTRSLHEAYFSGLTYYHARDLMSHERIGKDVPALVQELASLTCNSISVLVRFLLFGVQLVRHSLLTPVRWRLPLACTAPGLAAIVALVHRRWPRVQAMQRQQRSVEAAVRRQHDRLRRHSDAVAMCCGETLEAAAISKRMAAMRRHGQRALVTTTAFDVVKGLAMRYGPHAVLMAVTLSTAKAGSSLSAGSDLVNGRGFEAAARMAQSLRLLWDVLAHQLQTALQFMRVTQSSPHLFLLAARLGSFALDLRWRQAWQRAWDKKAVITDSPGFVRFKDMTACTPAGCIIVEQLNLRVNSGEHLLVQGPLGSGKTALARCLGSLWPSPVGSMALPGGQALGLARPGFLYLPERPLLGRGPTLRHQLALPCFPGQHARELDMEEVTRLLHVVGLGGSADGAGLALGSCSLADQQRLGMAQLLYYRPTFAILDACTSALPPEEEASILRACAQAHITLIAFMDVPLLQGDVFRRALQLQGGGKWCVVEKLTQVDLARADEPEFRRGNVHEASVKAAATKGRSWSPTLKLLGQRAIFLRLGLRACRRGGRNVLAGGAAALAAVALGLIRAAAAERAAAESAAALRAAVVGPCFWKSLWPLLAKSALAGTVEAMSSALHTQLCARARLACRCQLSSFLLRRCLLGNGGGRVYCLLNHRFSEGLDRVLTDDVQAITAGAWKLISDVSRRLGDMAIFGRALWQVSSLAGVGTQKRIAFTTLFSTDASSLGELVFGGCGIMVLLLSISWLEFTIAYFASGCGISGDSTAVRHRKSAENGMFAAHSRLRRESERIAFAHAEAQERTALEEAIHFRAAAQRQQNRWEFFWSMIQQVTTRFASQHLIWSLCVARCVHTPTTLHGSSATDVVIAFGDALYYLRYISAIMPLLGNAIGGWGEFLERLHVTSAPAARVHGLVCALENLEQQAFSNSHRTEAATCACGSMAMCSTPHGARPQDSSSAVEFVDVELQAGLAQRGADSGTLPTSKCRSPTTNAASEGPSLKHLNLNVGAGDGGLFICGPVGVGKTMVARGLCGLRPAAGGMIRPLPVGDTMYLTLWPHLAGETLLDHLTYPQLNQSSFSAEVAERMEMVMSAAEAAHLLDGLSGTVQASERWSDSLSLDDRQRLAFARLLWHAPRFAVLDECTTALPRAVEVKVLAACELAGITLIITSRRPPELVHSCTQVLALEGGEGAGWRLEDRRGQQPGARLEVLEADRPVT